MRPRQKAPHSSRQNAPRSGTYLDDESAVEDEGADADVTETVNVPEEGEGECHQQGQQQQHHRTEDTRRLPKRDETMSSQCQ